MKQVHRQTRGRYSLCGLERPLTELSIHDEHVTCQDCIDILCELRLSVTHTQTLNKKLIIKETTIDE